MPRLSFVGIFTALVALIFLVSGVFAGCHVTTTVITVVHPAPTCVNGAPASKGEHSQWDINYFNATPARADSQHVNLGLDPKWFGDHKVSSMSLSMNHGKLDEYAVFKCQFSCNDAKDCVSFFGRFEDVGHDVETFNCYGFDTLIDDGIFVADDDKTHIGLGGYNKLCKGEVAHDDPTVVGGPLVEST